MGDGIMMAGNREAINMVAMYISLLPIPRVFARTFFIRLITYTLARKHTTCDCNIGRYV